MKENNINNQLKNIPSKPGVYKFKDEDNKIIYVGKAKNLKKRVNSYFVVSKEQTAKTVVMVNKIATIETIVVDSELEAIMLETNLIKELRPKYNILMKDDKNFLYIKITVQDKYPKIYLTRKISEDNALYFGPKTSGFEIKKTVKILSHLLKYPQCQINIEWIKDGIISKNQKLKSVCEFKEIDKDHTPCISELTPEEYKESIDKIIDFFKGKQSTIQQSLKNQMNEYAKNKEFEKAEIYFKV
jgi:excinuclease ABC subunit C